MSRVMIVNNTSVYVHRFRRELIAQLGRSGHEVVLVCPDDAHTPKLADLGIHRLAWPLQQHGTDPRAEFKAARFLVRTARRIRPDVVINFTVKSAIYGSIAARSAKAKSCFSVFTGLGHYFTDSKIDSPGARLIRFMLRRALASNQAVFFQNTADRELFVQRGLVAPDKTRMMNGSGVNVAEYRPANDAPVPESFLFIGRLLPDKGVREFVEAARRVRTSYPDSQFWLLGGIDTSRTAIPRSEVEGWEREGIVRYLGEQDDVRPVIARSSVMVLPSYYREGVPRSILESMAMGKPIVTTNMPGCRDCVDDGVNGLLVEPRSPEALAAAMTRMLSDRDMVARMGAASRAIALEKYDVHRVNDAFLRDCRLL